MKILEAIFFGNKEIMKILEDKGIQKNNLTYIETALLSYRNNIAKELFYELKKQNDENEYY